MNVVPQRDKVLCAILPSPESSGLVVRPQTETPVRRVVVKAVGPDADPDLVVEGLYLATLLPGQMVGEEQVVLPSAPGQSAFLARWEE